MTMNIDWQTGKPGLEGTYIVAVALGENSGCYSLAYWDGSQWSSSRPREIIAHYPALDLIDKLHLAWPQWHSAAQEKLPQLPAPPDAEDWEEVATD